LVLLKAPYAKDFFLALNGALDALEKATRDGTAFVFGFLGADRCRSPKPIPVRASCLRSGAAPGARGERLVGAAVSLAVLPWVVKGFSLVLEKTMGSAARSACPPRERVRRQWSRPPWSSSPISGT